MSNSNKKIKASDIVVNSDSEAGNDSLKAARVQKIYKLMLWLGIIGMIAYVVLLIVFVNEGRGLVRMNTGKRIMLAAAITGCLAAEFLAVCTVINKTLKMFSVGVALIGVFCMSLGVTYMLLLQDYTKGTNTEGFGSFFAALTAGSLVIGIILMIVAGIRKKVAEKKAHKKA